MKRFLVILFFAFPVYTVAQNEFAATSFYNTLKKIKDDGEKGFAACKGQKMKSPYEDLEDAYKAKFMLPLADSGKVVFPVSGPVYAVYFFEPEKKLVDIEKRASNLREAVATATGGLLYSKATTTKIDDYINSNTYIYLAEEETDTRKAIYRISIYRVKKRYHLSLEIRGKNN
ncbi:MAG TPA: hypothetical protein PKC72_14195 [Chitinophagaceae bacterium]|nr:hypothetical protein [Chitinophagaceae bacterium]